jgi:hypothetical protein
VGSPATSWSHTTLTSTPITFSGAGKWVVTVAARNALGWFGHVGTWEVWFDHPPTAPGSSSMTINGQDTIISRPFVARTPFSGHALAWTASTDLDAGETLTYEVQISTAPDCLTNIVVYIQNITTQSQNWTGITESGTHFWRIRSNDGKQSSDWSRIGSFIVNIPPDRPGGLAANQR